MCPSLPTLSPIFLPRCSSRCKPCLHTLRKERRGFSISVLPHNLPPAGSQEQARRLGGVSEKCKVGVPAAPSQPRAMPETQERARQGEVTCCGMRVGEGWHLRHLRWRQLAHWFCQAPCQLTGAILISLLEDSYLCCPLLNQPSSYPRSLYF